jgi:myosin-5
MLLQTACIHTPRVPHSRSTAAALPRRSASGDGSAAASQSAAAAAQNKAWTDILAVFDQLLTTLKDNHVPQPLVRALFKQLFSFVNVQLFNQLLLRRECCSFSNGEYVKTGLALVSVLQGGGRGSAGSRLAAQTSSSGSHLVQLVDVAYLSMPH